MTDGSSLLLTTERVLELHRVGITRFGGHPGLREGTDCVEGALGSALNAEVYVTGGVGRVPGLVLSVAVLTYLAMRHCFVDGNKRVAWSAMVDVLAKLGLTVIADDDEAEAFVIDVVTGQLSREQATLWISKRLAAIS